MRRTVTLYTPLGMALAFVVAASAGAGSSYWWTSQETGCARAKDWRWSGEICDAAGVYKQCSDRDGKRCEGGEFDRRVEEGSPFPPSLNNHHFVLR